MVACAIVLSAFCSKPSAHLIFLFISYSTTDTIFPTSQVRTSDHRGLSQEAGSHKAPTILKRHFSHTSQFTSSLWFILVQLYNTSELETFLSSLSPSPACSIPPYLVSRRKTLLLALPCLQLSSSVELKYEQLMRLGGRKGGRNEFAITYFY